MNTEFASTAEPDDAREWQAHRYVLGEMTLAERLAFEQQLATDIDLCLLVSDQQMLCEAVRAALAPSAVMAPCPATRAGSGRGRLQLVGLSAAVLLGMMIWTQWPGGPVPPENATPMTRSGSPVDPMETAPQVLAAWSQLKPDALGEATDSASFDIDSSGTESSVNVVPDWMLIAAESGVVELMDEMSPGTGGTL